MKTSVILACLLLCGLPLCAYAQKTAAAPPPTSATSTIETVRRAGLEFVVTTNRKFNYVALYTGSGYESMLLLEEIRTELSREVEGINSAMKVDAWLGKGHKPDKKAWTIKSAADAATAAEPFYRTTKYGCCAALSTWTWYNLFTGQKVFTGNTNLVKISVPNTGGDALDRFVTFHSNMASVEAPERKRGKDILGVLEYGSNKRATHRLVLRTADSETFDLGPPEVGVTHQKETRFAKDDQSQEVALWAYDGKKSTTSLSDFTVILKWEDAVQIVIPFKNDAPVLSEAKVPAKIKLELPSKP
jgi:hypothetical protein